MNSQMLNPGTLPLRALSLDLSLCVSHGSGLPNLKEPWSHSFQPRLGTLVPSTFTASPEGSIMVGWGGSPE